ncbi:MAG: sugar transferase [Trueperaceae bacterium]|nr:MAG: sugar transferase [Trueperaceae bacterium]
MAKRLFDLVAASLGLLLLSPLFLAVAIAIRRSSPGPVFFRQQRVGRGGVPFSMFKFRTMRPDAERVGGQLTVGADPRITPIGHTLRRYKLDEFPQLINVVLGDMSLVGPRPEVPRYVALYDERQRRVLDVRPGITDPASIAYRDENALLANAEDPEATYVDEVMPAKLDINLAYLERRSLLSDIGVILQTLMAVVRR